MVPLWSSPTATAQRRKHSHELASSFMLTLWKSDTHTVNHLNVPQVISVQLQFVNTSHPVTTYFPMSKLKVHGP